MAPEYPIDTAHPPLLDAGGQFRRQMRAVGRGTNRHSTPELFWDSGGEEGFPPVRHPTRRRREQGCACGTVAALSARHHHIMRRRRPFVLVVVAKLAADINWGVQPSAATLLPPHVRATGELRRALSKTAQKRGRRIGDCHRLLGLAAKPAVVGPSNLDDLREATEPKRNPGMHGRWEMSPPFLFVATGDGTT